MSNRKKSRLLGHGQAGRIPGGGWLKIGLQGEEDYIDAFVVYKDFGVALELAPLSISISGYPTRAASGHPLGRL
jgi:hypothetical protein